MKIVFLVLLIAFFARLIWPLCIFLYKNETAWVFFNNWLSVLNPLLWFVGLQRYYFIPVHNGSSPDFFGFLLAVYTGIVLYGAILFGIGGMIFYVAYGM